MRASMTKDLCQGDKRTCHQVWAPATVSAWKAARRVLRTRLRVARAERVVSQEELARAVVVLGLRQ